VAGELSAQCRPIQHGSRQLTSRLRSVVTAEAAPPPATRHLPPAGARPPVPAARPPAAARHPPAAARRPPPTRRSPLAATPRPPLPAARRSAPTRRSPSVPRDLGPFTPAICPALSRYVGALNGPKCARLPAALRAGAVGRNSNPAGHTRTGNCCTSRGAWQRVGARVYVGAWWRMRIPGCDGEAGDVGGRGSVGAWRHVRMRGHGGHVGTSGGVGAWGCVGMRGGTGGTGARGREDWGAGTWSILSREPVGLAAGPGPRPFCAAVRGVLCSVWTWVSVHAAATSTSRCAGSLT
jgi:hypothetical protein